ncbi:unnamed protein product [Caenorhabditis brenneri]
MEVLDLFLDSNGSNQLQPLLAKRVSMETGGCDNINLDVCEDVVGYEGEETANVCGEEVMITDKFMENVKRIWSYKKNKCSSTFICNTCGKQGGEKITWFGPCFQCSNHKFIYSCNQLPAKFIRVGVKSQLQQVLIHNSVRREVIRRMTAEQNSSTSFRHFVNRTKGLVPRQVSYKNPVMGKLDNVDSTVILDHTLFSTLTLGCGKLVSRYFDPTSSDDFLFAVKQQGQMECSRFIGAIVVNGEVFAIVEPLDELPQSQQYSSIVKAEQLLDGTDKYFAREVIKTLEFYEGIKYGRLSGRRSVVPIRSIVSTGVYVDCIDGLCVTAANGAMIHN